MKSERLRSHFDIKPHYVLRYVLMGALMDQRPFCNDAILEPVNDRACDPKYCADCEANDSIVEGSNTKRIPTLPTVIVEPWIGG